MYGCRRYYFDWKTDGLIYYKDIGSNSSGVMIVGLIISLLQTLTSIQEQTLTFVPKLLAIMLALMIMGPWLLNEIVSYMNILWGSFAQYIS